MLCCFARISLLSLSSLCHRRFDLTRFHLTCIGLAVCSSRGLWSCLLLRLPTLPHVTVTSLALSWLASAWLGLFTSPPPPLGVWRWCPYLNRALCDSLHLGWLGGAGYWRFADISPVLAPTPPLGCLPAVLALGLGLACAWFVLSGSLASTRALLRSSPALRSGLSLRLPRLPRRCLAPCGLPPWGAWSVVFDFIPGWSLYPHLPPVALAPDEVMMMMICTVCMYAQYIYTR